MFINNDIVLMPLEINHLEYIQRWQNDYSISRFTSIDTFIPRNFHEEEKWFDKQMSLTNKRTFIIKYVEDIVGFVSYSGVDLKNGIAYMSIVIGEEKYRGKGIAKTALKLLEEYLKDELNLRKIKAQILENNSPSIALFESLEYVREAILLKEVYRDSKYYDVYVYTKFLRKKSGTLE